MRICKKCNAPVDAPKGWRCLACIREVNRRSNAKYRASEKGRAVAREYRRSEAYKQRLKQALKRYYSTDKGKQKLLEYRQHPHCKARKALGVKIQFGRMVRKPCEVCGDPRSQAHHHRGYERQFWFDVKWLCAKHHREAEKREAENARGEAA